MSEGATSFANLDGLVLVKVVVFYPVADPVLNFPKVGKLDIIDKKLREDGIEFTL